MLSRRLIEAVKLAPERQYRLAQRVGILPSTLSKWLNAIEPVKPTDPRLIKLGRLLGLREDELVEHTDSELAIPQR